MMAMDFSGFIFLLLLQLTASRAVTSGQNAKVTVTEVMVHNQTTANNSSSIYPTPEVSDLNITQPTKTDVKTTQSRGKPSLQTTPTAVSKTLSPNISMTATNTQSPQLENSTLGTGTTPETTEVTSQANNQTTASASPTVISNSSQSQDTGKTSTSFTSNKTTQLSTHPTVFTDLISTSIASTMSRSPSPAIDGEATESTSLFETPKATTKTPYIHTTKAKKRQDPQKKRDDSKAVAGVIGGALILMMVGFLIIYLKKRKLKRQQITTKDWAGPSPFLDGGAENSQVELRSSNRISLSSFLPQRLSKRLSLLQEAEEEMEDMTPGSTFGNQNQGSTFGQEGDRNGVTESIGMAGANVENTGDTPQTVEKSEPSAQTKDPLTTNNNSEDPKPSQNSPASSTSPTGDVENFPVQLSNGLGQP